MARDVNADIHSNLIDTRDEGVLLSEQLPRIQARADCSATSFTPSFIQGDPGQGIGGFDLKSTVDRIFPFDYDHSGKQDHIVAYRPGVGAIRILTQRDGLWIPRYTQLLFGIGGYDLKSPADQGFAYDFDHSGKLDHIVFFRSGSGTIWILKNTGGVFSAVYRTSDSGIGGYDLKSPADRVLPFDYEHSGKQDYLLAYRPGNGSFAILKNTNGVFTPVQSGSQGIGGYDLKSPNDQIFPFDFDSSGKLDHLVMYRPGTGGVWIVKNLFGYWAAVFLQVQPGKGIGGFDLLSTADRGLAYDFAGTGRLDYLVFYRPGTGIAYVLRNSGGFFTAIYQEGISGRGLGGYDLLASTDQVIAFDSDSKGLANALICYRPGVGALYIMKRA